MIKSICIALTLVCTETTIVETKHEPQPEVKNCWNRGGYKTITVYNDSAYRVDCKRGGYYERGIEK